MWLLKLNEFKLKLPAQYALDTTCVKNHCIQMYHLVIYYLKINLNS